MQSAGYAYRQLWVGQRQDEWPLNRGSEQQTNVAIQALSERLLLALSRLKEAHIEA